MGIRQKDKVITHRLVKGTKGFEVHLDCRKVVYCGETEEEAYTQALTGVAELAREGYIDPRDPDSPSIGRVSHLIALAASALMALSKEASNGVDEPTRHAAKTRLSAVATAVAALARIDLD